MFRSIMLVIYLVCIVAVPSYLLSTYTMSELGSITFEPKHKEKKCCETHQQHLSIHTVIQSLRNNQPVNACISLRNKKVLIHSGVPRKDEKSSAIIIYCPGYSGPLGNARYKYKGGGAYSVSKAISSGIINTTTMTFDFPTDSLNTFNFGQTDDQGCVKLVYNYVVKKHPNRPIILFGDCRGATTILNFIASCRNWKHIENVKAVVLFYPSLSLQHLSKQVSENYLSWMPYSNRFLHAFFLAIFPRYKANTRTILDIKNCVPPQLPILICCLKNDAIVSYKEVEILARHLKKSNNPFVHLFTIQSPLLKHGKLTESYESAQMVNLFLKQYGLPYDYSLAYDAEQHGFLELMQQEINQC